MTTLDNVERKLVTDDLLICDGEGPIGLAGVMGGANTEIQPGTKRVLFECAYFEPRGVRRASRRHGLHTEASHRFERGVDPGDVRAVLARATSLATELAGGAAVRGEIHAGDPSPKRITVTLRGPRLDQLVGDTIPLPEARAILERLGCGVTEKGKDALDVLVPTHRPDIGREVDVIDEVARIRGMDRIKGILPAIHPTSD